MRMVIVQKDESLESLADRYDVSPSQILRLNGLDSGQLEEGQIIYIPGEERKTPHDGSA
jgi:stage VI sporulation protein D